MWEGIRTAYTARYCKRLAWHACKEALPVRSRMIQKRIVECHVSVLWPLRRDLSPRICPCDEMKRIWFGSLLGHRVDALPGESVATFLDWVEHCVGTLDAKGMGMVWTMMWALWNRRNAWMLRRRRMEFEEVVDKAVAMSISDQWTPPPSPLVKANFHASVMDNVGTGMGTNFLQGECYEQPIAEAFCFRWVIEKSGELCFPEVMFETECKQLHSEWRKTDTMAGSYSFLESLVEECRMMTHGRETSLTFVCDTSNKVAQSISEFAFDYGDRVWIEEVIDEVSEFLENDFQGIVNLY
ncbi:hypothetical protein VNO78_12525 [Psophocarpus tetragonolobus]|uniref:Uncharacterized protein n=1 Tax=Psophocarpus tetragonolobus TaxID=3891 RepID=A0AAN9SW13_PSOTE